MLNEKTMSWEPDEGLENLTYEHAQSELVKWFAILKMSQLVIGDILKWAALATGETDELSEADRAKSKRAWHWAQLLPETYKATTLRSYKSIAERIPPENRIDHPALTYSHLRHVAPVPEDSQIWWLNKSIDNRWNAQQLKAAIDAHAGLPAPTENNSTFALFSRTRDVINSLIDSLIDLSPNLRGSKLIQEAYSVMDDLNEETAVSVGSDDEELEL